MKILYLIKRKFKSHPILYYVDYWSSFSCSTRKIRTELGPIPWWTVAMRARFGELGFDQSCSNRAIVSRVGTYFERMLTLLERKGCFKSLFAHYGGYELCPWQGRAVAVLTKRTAARAPSESFSAPCWARRISTRFSLSESVLCCPSFDRWVSISCFAILSIFACNFLVLAL